MIQLVVVSYIAFWSHVYQMKAFDKTVIIDGNPRGIHLFGSTWRCEV